jgi:hypothetical protein
LTLSVFASQIHLPRRGRFCSTYRKVPKSSPFGGAGIERSEMTERVILRHPAL